MFPDGPLTKNTKLLYFVIVLSFFVISAGDSPSQSFRKHVQYLLNSDHSDNAIEGITCSLTKNMKMDIHEFEKIVSNLNNGVYILSDTVSYTQYVHTSVLVLYMDGTRKFYFTELHPGGNTAGVPTESDMIKNISKLQGNIDADNNDFSEFIHHIIRNKITEDGKVVIYNALDHGNMNLADAVINMEKARLLWARNDPVFKVLGKNQLNSNSYTHYLILQGLGKGVWKTVPMASGQYPRINYTP